MRDDEYGSRALRRYEILWITRGRSLFGTYTDTRYGSNFVQLLVRELFHLVIYYYSLSSNRGHPALDTHSSFKQYVARVTEMHSP